MSQHIANLSTLLAQTAALFPDRPGLIQGEKVWTWSEINARVDALVQGLRSLGVKAGDKILVQSRNNAPLFESCWAAFRLGAVWVPTNFRLTPPEVAYLGSSSERVVMLSEDCFAAHVDAVKSASSTCAMSSRSASRAPARRLREAGRREHRRADGRWPR